VRCLYCFIRTHVHASHAAFAFMGPEHPVIDFFNSIHRAGLLADTTHVAL
jgi:hypothetical protein